MKIPSPIRPPALAILCLLGLLPVEPLGAFPAGPPPGPPPPPILSIAPQGNTAVTLQWGDSNSWLQSTPFLGSPFFWTNVNGAPATSMTVPIDKPAEFFRLIVSPTVPPPTELNLQPASDTNGDFYFELNWDAVPGAVSYNLYLAAAPGVTSSNYSLLPGGLAFMGIPDIFAAVPDVPNGVFTPALTPGTAYYFVVTAVSSDGVESANSNPAMGVFGPAGAVRGAVFARLAVNGQVENVNLPNVSLTLVNNGNPSMSNSVSSDLNGDFTFPPLPAGSYNLCWRARGFLSACSNGIVIGNGQVELDNIQLFPDGAQAMVFGQVTYQDGSPVYDVDPSFQISVDPVVTLTSSSNTTVGTARLNSAGQYFISGFSASDNMTIGVTLEGSSVSSNINTFVVGEADLVLPDTPPIIQSLVASTNGIPVRSVPPGTTVDVTVTAIGNNLSYAWFDVNGLTTYPSDPVISWTIPGDAAGFQYLWVRVSDGNGGYAEARLELTVSPSALFSGTVYGSDTGSPVPGALVQVNDLVANTDTNGYFAFDVDPTNQFRLTITADGYVPLTETFPDPVADRDYTLISTTIPSNYCPTLNPITFATNCASGVIVGIPNSGLVDSNDIPYSGCISVSLNTLDPCDPANNFFGGNFITNGSILQPYGLVDIEVADLSGNPLHLAPGFGAELFLPISQVCVDTNCPQPAQAATFELDQASGQWTVAAMADLTTNLNCAGVVTGYDSFVTQFGLQCCGRAWGPPAAVPVPPSVNFDLKINVDDSLHPPLRLVLMWEDCSGKPDPKSATYYTINYSGALLTGARLPVGDNLWVEVLNLRQAPGYYFGAASPVPDDSQKDIIQALKYTVPANPPKPVPVTLGLGKNVDVPRLAQLKGLAKASVGTGDQAGPLGQAFLTRGMASVAATYDALKDYYPRIDKPKKKTNFHDWQVANGWDPAKIGTYGGIGKGDDAFAVYFNSDDLGAGRRVGMKTYNDLDGKPSVAYYIATYNTLADAESDDQAGRQPGGAGGKLKYMVCMEFSLPRNEKNEQAGKDRYIKFFAFANAAGAQLPLTGLVPNESRAKALPVPYLCIKCHGGGYPDFVPSVSNTPPEFGDIRAQFVPFDMANYTFITGNAGASLSPTKLLPAFKSLEQGLLTGQGATASMPPNLKILLDYMTGSNPYTTAPPPKKGAWDWSDDPNSIYAKVYSVSCRSCHVTQCGDAPGQNGGENWSTPGGFATALQMISGGAGDNDLAESPYMPHAQRIYGIYWGSAVAQRLNDQKIVPAPKVRSQPSLANEISNDDYFQ